MCNHPPQLRGLPPPCPLLPTCFFRSILDRFHRRRKDPSKEVESRREHGQRIYFSRAKFMYDGRRDGCHAERWDSCSSSSVIDLRRKRGYETRRRRSSVEQGRSPPREEERRRSNRNSGRLKANWRTALSESRKRITNASNRLFFFFFFHKRRFITIYS